MLIEVFLNGHDYFGCPKARCLKECPHKMTPLCVRINAD